MSKKTIPLLLLASSALIAGQATAQSFSSFDPRSMALGGAGVAVSRPDTATYFNPALLSLPREGDDFSLQIPYIGVRAYDPGDFADSIDDAQNAVDNLEATIDAMNTDSNLIDDQFDQLVSDTAALNDVIIAMDEDVIVVDTGLGIAGGVPGPTLGVGVFVTGRGSVNGVFDYQDGDDLDTLVTDAALVSDCINTPSLSTCNPNNLQLISIDTGTIDDPIEVTVNFDPNNDLTSLADLRGVALGEVGISFSHLFHGYAIGITPKQVKVKTFDYRATVDDADTDDVDANDYVKEYSDFNMDFGIAKDYSENLNIGFVIKNMIKQEYATVRKDEADYEARGGDIVLSPQARIGVAYQGKWGLIAADLDLTKNKALGFEKDSQQLSLGAEFDAFGILQLRVGYRSDIEDTDRSVASAGVGLALLGTHLDVAVSGNEDELGGAIEFGLAF